MMRMMLGGMRKPRVPAPASEPIARVAVVAAAQQLRQGDAPHRRGGRGRGAGDRREHRAPEHVDVEEPSRQAGRPRGEPGEEGGGEPRVEQDLRHQDEERKRDELRGGGHVPGELGEELLDRHAAEDAEADEARGEEGEPDPHPEPEPEGEHAKDDSRGKDGHRFIPPRTPAAPPRPRAGRPRGGESPAPRAEG